MKNANHGAIDNAQLISIIERIEKLNEETAAIAADIKEVYSEAKSAGFDPKYIRQMIRLRKLDPDDDRVSAGGILAIGRERRFRRNAGPGTGYLQRQRRGIRGLFFIG